MNRGLRLYKGKLYNREQDLVQGALDYLSRIGFAPIHHRNVGAILRRGGKIMFGKQKTSQRGIADVILAYRGIPLAIEVKASDGKVDPDQAEWLMKWQAPPNYGKVIIMQSMDDLVNGLLSMDRIAKISQTSA